MTYTLAELADVVRKSREKTNPYYPMPNVEKSFRFAFTECGEFEDALLREDQTFARNNNRDRDARAEYGQVGYMIATAVFQLVDDPSCSYDGMNYTYRMGKTVTRDESDMYDVAKYLVSAIRRHQFAHETLTLWARSCYNYGYDPMELLKETCAAVEAKRIPNVGKETD